MRTLKIISVPCILSLAGMIAAWSNNASVPAYAMIAPVATPTPSTDQAPPQYSSYRGVSIGTVADNARAKLGTPKERSNSGDYFVFSETETAQLIYDKDQKVKAITVNFTGDLRSAPTPKEVVGVDIKKDPDGSISKMVSYPKDGYWVSYIRTGGKDAMIIITLQKLTVD